MSVASQILAGGELIPIKKHLHMIEPIPIFKQFEFNVNGIPGLAAFRKDVLVLNAKQIPAHPKKAMISSLDTKSSIFNMNNRSSV